MEASAQPLRGKLCSGKDKGLGAPETNPSPADEDASLCGGKAGSLEGTLCSQPPDSGEQRHVCVGGGREEGGECFSFKSGTKDLRHS